MNIKKRYSNIDIMKSVGAFLVVCIHAPFPGTVGKYVIAFSQKVSGAMNTI